METKTIFALSMCSNEVFETPKTFMGDKTDLFVDGLQYQEVTLKGGLTLQDIDTVYMFVDRENFDNFKTKEFLLKDFDSNIICQKENVLTNFLVRIQDYICDKNQYHISVEINKHLFSSLNSENYLTEYREDKKTRTTVNNYLKKKTKQEINEFMHSLFVLSNKKAVSRKNNINLNVIICLYGSEGDGSIDIGLLAENTQKAISRFESANILLSSHGFSNSDYHFLRNIFNLLDKDNTRYKITGVLNTIKHSDCYIETIINEEHIPDSSVILSLLKTYSSTSKLSALHALDNYLKEREIPTKFLNRYISSLSFIESGVALCNISVLKFGISALKKAHELPKDKSLKNENAKIVLAIFRNLIDEMFGLLIETEKLNVSNLIVWCIKNEYYQQTLTIIESLIPQDIVESGVLYYAANKEDADLMIERWNKYYWKENPRTRYNFDDLGHYFIKNYGRNAVNNSQAKDKLYNDLVNVYVNATKGLVPQLGMFYTNINNDQLIKDLLLSYYRIGKLRNTVAHAMPQKEKTLEDIDNLGEDENYELVKKETALFRDLYKAALDICNGPRPYIIFNKTFKEYTKEHRLDPKEIKF